MSGGSHDGISVLRRRERDQSSLSPQLCEDTVRRSANQQNKCQIEFYNSKKYPLKNKAILILTKSECATW